MEHFAQSVPYEVVADKDHDYNLSVSSYVQAKDNREVVDIAKLNAELKTTVVGLTSCGRRLSPLWRKLRERRPEGDEA